MNWNKTGKQRTGVDGSEQVGELGPTHLLHSAVRQHDGVGGVEVAAAQEVADLGGVHHSVATIPEVKEIEDFLHICATHRKHGFSFDSKHAANTTALRRRTLLLTITPTCSCASAHRSAPPTPLRDRAC